jgi:hypothetical protein
VSVILASGLIWRFAPGLFGELGTLELIAIAGLLVLPFLTWWGLSRDRAASMQQEPAKAQAHAQAQVQTDVATTAVNGPLNQSPVHSQLSVQPPLISITANASAPTLRVEQVTQRADRRTFIHEPAMAPMQASEQAGRN